MRRAIVEAYESGIAIAVITKAFKICTKTAYNTVNNYSERGSSETAPRSGRKRKTTATTDRLIVRKVRENPKITAQELKLELNLDLGLTQLRSRIHEQGLYGRVCRRKPFISPVNRRKRLEFALKYRYADLDFWKSILWSDESKFELLGSKRRAYVYRKPGEEFKERNTTATVKHGGKSRKLWGCFSWHGTGHLALIEGIMTARVYIDI